MTAAFIVAAVALLALAIDTGRLYAAQARLQSAANLAALDAARAASECRNDLSDGSPDDAALASVAQNFAGRDEDSRPALARLDTGRIDARDGLYAFDDATGVDDKPNGVRLTLTDRNFQPLFALFNDEETTLSASAGARSLPTAGLQLGTTLASVEPELLSALLGTDVDVASLGDLAEVSVTLADLLGVDASAVTREDVARVTVGEALDNVSDQINTLSRSVVGTVQSVLGDQPLSEILDLAGPVGGEASIALGSIVNAAAQLVAADRESAVDLPLDLDSLPTGLGGVSVDLRLLEPASLAIGPAGTNADGDYYTTVYSSQVSLGLRLDLNLELGGLAEVARVTLPVAIQVAQGRADLERIDCPSRDDRRYRVATRASTAPAAAAIGTVNEDGSINTDARAAVRVLGTSVAEVFNYNDAQSTLPEPDDYTPVFDDIQDLDDLPRTIEADQELRTADIASLLGNINLDFELLQNNSGGWLGSILDGLGDLLSELTRPLLRGALNGITDLLQTLTETALGPILDPILDQLGISLATPTLTLTGLEPAQPELFCTSADACGFENTSESTSQR
ncbi:hypothetical protein SAOR_03585 [Salinisphaera orenii MK-B5]|uniref:Putative Flp pilus-assembly TadG-like N-terminal domain-containing protein n=2 Tax=Salinisphaera TaxID=180541 RepID=A0A423PVB4_9GAMM|nr:hypothetical protein SAOR_03585 [Salinisphaera orenii MK-B5]